MSDIPCGYCQCGCGQKTKIAKETSKREGHIIGQPFRYIHRHSSRLNLQTRLWKKVNKQGALWTNPTTGEQSHCWEWQGERDKHGYGLFFYKGKHRQASRIVYGLMVSEIPSTLCALHHCDNPICVNPDHIFIGTRADNILDMTKKGRRVQPERKGTKHPMAKITEDDVRAMRLDYQNNVTQRALAARYHLSNQHVSSIIHRKSWAHVS